MLIKESKLRSIIKQVLAEARYNGTMPPGFSMTSGGDGGGNSRFDEFCEALHQMVTEAGQQITSVSVIDPNALEEEYGGISDDVHGALNGNPSNNIYHNFGQGMQEDNIQDLFRAEGPQALDDFCQWAQTNFADFEDSDMFSQSDSVSAFYQGKDGEEYQVTVMFF